MITSNNSQFLELELSLLFPSPTNPRKTFDQDEINGLADSIRIHGVLQPILVRKGTDPEGVAGYEIVAGERRYRASLVACLTHIPCRIGEFTDEEVLEIQIIENLQRKDVDPLDEARAFKYLIDHHRSFNVEEISKRVAKSNVYVYQRLKLLDLTEKAQDLLHKNIMQLGHAHHLSKLPAKSQEKALNWMLKKDWNDSSIILGVESVTALKRFISNNFHLDLNEAKWDKKDAKLCPDAGACIMCTKRTGYNMNLFEDIEEKDACLDSTCYNEKTAAFIESEIKRFKKAKVDLYKLMPSWKNRDSENKKDVLYFEDYSSENSLEDHEAEQIPPDKWKNGIYIESINGKVAGEIIRFIDQDFYDAFEFKQEDEKPVKVSDPGEFDPDDHSYEIDSLVIKKVIENHSSVLDSTVLDFLIEEEYVSFDPIKAEILAKLLKWKLIFNEDVTNEDENDEYFFENFVSPKETVVHNISSLSLELKVSLLHLIMKLKFSTDYNKRIKETEEQFVGVQEKIEAIAEYKKQWELDNGITPEEEDSETEIPEPDELPEKSKKTKKNTKLGKALSALISSSENVKLSDNKKKDDDGHSTFVSALLSD